MLEPLLAAESVPVPDQLRNPDGVTKLRQLLKDEFGISRQHQLHCLKLACRWPDYRTAYADLLGVLTAFKDVEALGCQWQGQKNNIHNPDRVPNQAADRFMHTMEDQSGLEHLIVFITSNVNLEDKVLELQRRSFKIIVLYHVPYVNQQPLNVIKAADEAHDWLPFLQCKMDTTELSISTYDAHVFHSGEVPGALATDTPMYIQTQQNHPSTMDQAYMMPAGALLLDAIHRSHPASDDELLRTVADICLANGLQSQSEGQLVLSPTSVCQVGEAIRHRQVNMADKLKATLQSDAYSPYFQIISGPVGTQPAILPKLAVLISSKHKIDPVSNILATVHINFTHPQTPGHAASVKSLVPSAKQHQHIMPDSNETQSKEVAEAAIALISDVKGCLQCKDHAFVLSAASACILSGLKSRTNGFLLHPVLLAQVGQHCNNLEYTGKLSQHLKSPASQLYFRLVDGPGQPAVALNISRLFSKKSLELRKRIKVISKHPRA